MRDDDDPDEPRGQIFYSGINPDADRAGYALTPGEPALQDGEPEYEHEVEQEVSPVKPPPETKRSVRREFASVFVSVASGFAVATIFCVGFVYGLLPDKDSRLVRPVLHAEQDGTDARINLREWAEKLAVGRIVDLIEYRLPFLAVVAMQGKSMDTQLWSGFRRLAAVALVAEPVEQQSMIKDLLRTCVTAEIPAFLVEDVYRLRSSLTSRSTGR